MGWDGMLLRSLYWAEGGFRWENTGPATAMRARHKYNGPAKVIYHSIPIKIKSKNNLKSVITKRIRILAMPSAYW